MDALDELLDSFYRRRVPDHWNDSLEAQASASRGGDPEARRLLDGMVSVRASIDVVIESEAGSEQARYHLNIEAGRMSVDDRPLRSPFLTLCHDLESFVVLERESGDSVLGFLGALAGQDGDLQLTSGRIQNLSGIDGILSFQLTGASPMTLKAQFGQATPGDEPRCRVRLSEETYGDLKRGTVSPQDVFLNGLIEIEGDMQMAMQIAMAAVAPG
ncbi:MAG: SCP2 sterol-binding domain-containing protein [Myxococcota bacterium]